MKLPKDCIVLDISKHWDFKKGAGYAETLRDAMLPVGSRVCFVINNIRYECEINGDRLSVLCRDGGPLDVRPHTFDIVSLQQGQQPVQEPPDGKATRRRRKT